MSHIAGAGQSPTERPGPVAWLLLILVRAYQLVVSPWIAPRCRFYPSCSAYAVTALRRHGALKGTWLAARRLLRCHPWNLGGIDHVPAKGATRRAATGASQPPAAPQPDLPTAADAADGPSADGHSTAA